MGVGAQGLAAQNPVAAQKSVLVRRLTALFGGVRQPALVPGASGAADTDPPTVAEMDAELRRLKLPAGGGKEEQQARLRGLGAEQLQEFRERTMAARAAVEIPTAKRGSKPSKLGTRVKASGPRPLRQVKAAAPADSDSDSDSNSDSRPPTWYLSPTISAAAVDCVAEWVGDGAVAALAPGVHIVEVVDKTLRRATKRTRRLYRHKRHHINTGARVRPRRRRPRRRAARLSARLRVRGGGARGGR